MLQATRRRTIGSMVFRQKDRNEAERQPPWGISGRLMPGKTQRTASANAARRISHRTALHRSSHRSGLKGAERRMKRPLPQDTKKKAATRKRETAVNRHFPLGRKEGSTMERATLQLHWLIWVSICTACCTVVTSETSRLRRPSTSCRRQRCTLVVAKEMIWSKARLRKKGLSASLRK